VIIAIIVRGCAGAILLLAEVQVFLMLAGDWAFWCLCTSRADLTKVRFTSKAPGSGKMVILVSSYAELNGVPSQVVDNNGEDRLGVRRSQVGHAVLMYGPQTATDAKSKHVGTVSERLTSTYSWSPDFPGEAAEHSMQRVRYPFNIPPTYSPVVDLCDGVLVSDGSSGNSVYVEHPLVSDQQLADLLADPDSFQVRTRYVPSDQQ
jgi:hypothetical protein